MKNKVLWPAVVSIAAGSDQLPLIQCARRMGFRVVAVDRDPGAPGFAHADVMVTKSTHDTDGVVGALRELRGGYDFRGVLARTSAPEALMTAAAVSKELGVAGLTPEVIRVSTEKSMLREFAALNGMPVPRGVRVSPEQIPVTEIRLPAIIKPDVTRVGKANVRLCTHPADIAAYVSEAAKASANGYAEVQSYVEGIDCSCLFLVRQGRALVITWWDELVGIDSRDQVVALGVSVPSVIGGTGAQTEAEGVVAALAGCHPTLEALLLLSFRVTMGGAPHMIEMHSDLGGDLIADVLLPAANPAFDFFELAVQVATAGITGVERVALEPTVLYYRREKAAGSVRTPGRRAGYQVFQRGSVDENLALLPAIVRSQGLETRVYPSHPDWLGRYRDGVS